MTDFVLFIGVMIVIVFAFMGSGMGPMSLEAAYADHFQQAEIICEANGGLKFLELDIQAHDVYCNNGAIFRDAVELNNES